MVGDSGIIYLSSKNEPTKTRYAVYDKVKINQNLMKPIAGRNSTIKIIQPITIYYSLNRVYCLVNGVRVLLSLCSETDEISKSKRYRSSQRPIAETITVTIAKSGPKDKLHTPNKRPHTQHLSNQQEAVIFCKHSQPSLDPSSCLFFVLRKHLLLNHLQESEQS